MIAAPGLQFRLKCGWAATSSHDRHVAQAPRSPRGARHFQCTAIDLRADCAAKGDPAEGPTRRTESAGDNKDSLHPVCLEEDGRRRMGRACNNRRHTVAESRLSRIHSICCGSISGN